MRMSTWLRPLIVRLSRPHPRRLSQRPAFRPRLEVLEDRLTPSGGLLDPTFGSGGIVHLPHATDQEAREVAVQPDGKVVVAGVIVPRGGYAYITVQRLNTDGSLDTTFNNTGSLTIKSGKVDSLAALALQPDGKILIGGSGGNSGGEFLVARVNPNGTLDTSFGNSRGLEVLTNVGEVRGLAVLTDPANPNNVTGIVAAVQGSANGTSCFEAVELSAAGKLNSSFGSGGLAVFANLYHGDVESVAVAPSGEIYLAGYVQFSSMTVPDGCVAAVTPSGALDTTFGGGPGYVLADPTGSHESEFYALAVQTLTANGQTVSRLLAAGDITDATGNWAGLVSAYTLGGTLDTTFGSGGSYTFVNPPGQSSQFKSLALEADGSIVVGGYQTTPLTNGTIYSEMLVGHLTAAGAGDTSFGPSGTGFTAVQDGLNSGVRGVAIDPRDGDIVACGYTYPTSGAAEQASILRLTAP